MSQVNISAVLIGDMMGIAILFGVAFSSFWRVRMLSREKKIVLLMAVTTMISCIADSVSSLVDGKPGQFNAVLVWGCNTWLYLGNDLIAIAWIFLVKTHLGINLSRLHGRLLLVLSLAAVALLGVNLITPIIFTVDENNLYARFGINGLYYVLYFLFLGDGLALYFYARRKSGSVKFFPVWAFIIPTAIGGLIQGFLYGVSTIAPFIAVSIGCIIVCLQNEALNMDKLTGLYNRFYLDLLERRVIGDSLNRYTMMMLDINDFKGINDTFGHKMGDKALVETAGIVRGVVDVHGEAIRYAGDEFIVILNTQDEERIQDIISRIQKGLRDLRQANGNPYDISVAIGYCKIDLSQSTIEAVFDRVDKLMYENKRTCCKACGKCAEGIQS